MLQNKGFSAEEIAKLKAKCAAKNTNYWLVQPIAEDQSYALFHFVGKYENQEVIFDAFLCTLELEYITEVAEEAIAVVQELYPKYKDADFEAEEGEHIELLQNIMGEISDDKEFDVQEFCEYDFETDFGIRLDSGLNIPEITEKVIEKFVTDFQNNTLKLDESFYSFDLSA